MPNKDPLRLFLVNIEPQITFNDESIFNSLHLRNQSKFQHNFWAHRLDGRFQRLTKVQHVEIKIKRS